MIAAMEELGAVKPYFTSRLIDGNAITEDRVVVIITIKRSSLFFGFVLGLQLFYSVSFWFSCISSAGKIDI